MLFNPAQKRGFILSLTKHPPPLSALLARFTLKCAPLQCHWQKKTWFVARPGPYNQCVLERLFTKPLFPPRITGEEDRACELVFR